MEENLKLIDQKQLARLLGLSTRTIRRWRREQKIPEPFVQDGYRPFWSIPQIKKWQQGDSGGHATKK